MLRLPMVRACCGIFELDLLLANFYGLTLRLLNMPKTPCIGSCQADCQPELHAKRRETQEICGETTLTVREGAACDCFAPPLRISFRTVSHKLKPANSANTLFPMCPPRHTQTIMQTPSQGIQGPEDGWSDRAERGVRLRHVGDPQSSTTAPHHRAPSIDSLC